jgi:hypothetical protein
VATSVALGWLGNWDSSLIALLSVGCTPIALAWNFDKLNELIS